MNDFLKDKFKTEATDLLHELEEVLLLLENDNTDKELIERAFRAMHTIKGNSNLFGFESIGEFTHDLETIFDLIREGKMTISSHILDIGLASVDHIRALLNDPNLTDPANKTLQIKMLEDIKIIVQGNGVAIKHEKNEELENREVTSYYILFRPDSDFLYNGSNPLFQLDDLSNLGNSKVFLHTEDLPDLSSMDPLKSYLWWEVILTTEISYNELKDVFLFVEDRCDIQIESIGSFDVLSNDKFLELLDKQWQCEQSIELSKVKEIILLSTAEAQVEKENVTITKSVKKDQSSIRVASEKLDTLLNLVSELVTVQASLALHSEQSYDPKLIAISESVDKITRRLRDNALGICLVSIETLLTRFQRMVRDLSQELGKEVIFTTEGSETELDKSIIESITDPILHILRNSIDHGLEATETRLSHGKPKAGKITLKAYYSGTNVIIQISDDGKGIDRQKVRNKAIEKKLINEGDVLTDKELFALIFNAGFSTAQKLTDISGRGVGLDVVKRNIEAIKGEVSVSSNPGQGTTFTIRLPLTLSIIDGLLVQVSDTFFIIPLTVINKCYEVPSSNFYKSFNNLIELDKEQVPYCNLREEFEFADSMPDYTKIVVVNYDDIKVGLTVDSVLGEYQAVLKPLGKLYKKIDLVSGATILGNGTVALVLDTNKLVKEYSNRLIIENGNNNVN